jgi:hypothetical protein
MVSEDSQDLGWLAMVHCLGDTGDLDQTADRKMSSVIHQGNDIGELVEVVSLRRPQWVLFEERDDRVPEISVSLDAIPEYIFPVIVVPAVTEHLAASEEADKLFQNVATRRSLDNGKFWSNLPSKCHRAATVDGAAETAFAIYESHDPSTGHEPFLLVFRTVRIFTA